MTYWCGECLVAWWPYMCPDGHCPECNGGTRRVHDPLSDDAVDRHRAALAERAARERSEHNHRLFDEFCAARDSLASPTDEINTAAIVRGLALDRFEAA